VALWFPSRAKTLQHLIDISMARNGAPTSYELDELMQNPELDLNIKEGLTYEPGSPLFREASESIELLFDKDQVGPVREPGAENEPALPWHDWSLEGGCDWDRLDL
jgi:hypothetical protein